MPDASVGVMTLTETTAADGTRTVTYPDGSKHLIRPDGTVWYAAPGDEYQLVSGVVGDAAGLLNLERGHLVSLPQGWTMTSMKPDVDEVLDHVRLLLDYVERLRREGVSVAMNGEEHGAELLLRTLIREEIRQEQHGCGTWNLVGPITFVDGQTSPVNFCGGCGAKLVDAEGSKQSSTVAERIVTEEERQELLRKAFDGEIGLRMAAPVDFGVAELDADAPVVVPKEPGR